MRKTLVTLTTFFALAGIMAVAQHKGPPDPAEMVQHQVGFLTKHLSLTTQQQQQATTIFTEAANNGKTFHDQMRTAHQNLQAAIQKNDAAGIEQASNAIGSLTTQMTAAHAKAQAAFFQTLTPDQQTKMNAMQSHHGGPGFGGPGWRGHGHGGPDGPSGPPPGAF
jgi:Spy/CpxP family protein refolding chaperone